MCQRLGLQVNSISGFSRAWFLVEYEAQMENNRYRLKLRTMESSHMVNISRLAVSLIIAFISNWAIAASDTMLQAGLAVVDITPSVPLRMAGYFYERLSTGIKDPLHAKAIVFRQGKE